MLLHAARERVQVARARVRRERLPRRERRARRAHRRVDVGRRAVRDARDRLRRRGIDHLEHRTRLGPRAVDVVAEHAFVLAEPGERFLVALRRRAVLHRLEDFGDGGHWASAETECGELERVRRRSAETWNGCGGGVRRDECGASTPVAAGHRTPFSALRTRRPTASVGGARRRTGRSRSARAVVRCR